MKKTFVALVAVATVAGSLSVTPAHAQRGVAVQWLLSRFAVSPLNSLLATFGLTAIVEAAIQHFWTADFRKLESVYSGQKLRVGELFVPVPELLTLVLAFSRRQPLGALFSGRAVCLVSLPLFLTASHPWGR